MNLIPQGNNPSASYAATYDAWNRLVELMDGEDTVQENQYDARNFRTIRKDYTDGALSETRHFYYTDRWQDIEERIDSSTDPEQQNVWGIRYIDDLVLRDRTTEDPLDERLYACQDANWNVTAIVDADGEAQERYEYDPYGNAKFLTPNFTARATSDFGWTTLFTGRYLNLATLIYDFRMRPYLTWLGVFPVRDPAEYQNGMGLYVAYFVPNGADPWGLIAVLDDAAEVAVVTVASPAVGTVVVGGAIIGVGSYAIYNVSYWFWGEMLLDKPVVPKPVPQPKPKQIDCDDPNQDERNKCKDDCDTTYDRDGDTCRRLNTPKERRDCWEDIYKDYAKCRASGY